jgi:hypothetical protein
MAETFIRLSRIGVDEIERDLRYVGLKLSDLDFAGIANEGMRLAASFAPVRSGALRRSIKASKGKSRATIRAGSKAVPYAGPINYGWYKRGIRASRFMQRADKEMRRTVPIELKRQIEHLIATRGMT